MSSRHIYKQLGLATDYTPLDWMGQFHAVWWPEPWPVQVPLDATAVPAQNGSFTLMFKPIISLAYDKDFLDKIMLQNGLKAYYVLWLKETLKSKGNWVAPDMGDARWIKYNFVEASKNFAQEVPPQRMCLDQRDAAVVRNCCTAQCVEPSVQAISEATKAVTLVGGCQERGKLP